MSFLSEFLKDSEEWLTDDLPKAFKKFIIDEYVKDSIKYERLKFQALAVKVVNAGEEAAVAAAIDELTALGIPLAAGFEDVLRKTYWKPFKLLGKALNFDWLVDT